MNSEVVPAEVVPPLLLSQFRKRNSCAESISRAKWASVTVGSGALAMLDR